jgi:fucose permease
VFAGIAICAAALIPVVQPSGKGPVNVGLPAWRNRRSLILFLLFASVLLEVGLFGFGPSALIALGTPEMAAARLASGFFVVFLMARLGLYWLTRWMPAQLLFLCGFVGIALCAVIAAAGWPALAYVLAGGCTGLTFPSFFVWGSTLLGRDPRIASLMLAAALFAVATGPLVLGLLLAQFGIGSLFMVLGIIAAVAASALCLTILQLWGSMPDRDPPKA